MGKTRRNTNKYRKEKKRTTSEGSRKNDYKSFYQDKNK